MDINKTCKLIQTDVYLYDISACHYVILDKLGFDLSMINKSNKQERNSQIGVIMKDNPNLINILRNITTSTISEYINKNNISKDDLILRAYDGIIVRKKLQFIDFLIPIELQEVYNFMLISSDRQKYIAINNKNKVIIKGVANRYDKIDKLLIELLTSIIGRSREVIFINLQNIKEKIEKSKDVGLFSIPSIDNKFSIILKEYGEVKVSNTLINFLTTDSIDKKKYYDLYLRSFCESVVIETS